MTDWLYVGFLVSLLVSLGLSISGYLRHRVANRICQISLKWRDLAGSGNFGHTTPHGLKVRTLDGSFRSRRDTGRARDGIRQIRL
jgi:hypothetical protein